MNMISVCIASHNGGNYIIQELNSILPQLGPNDEIVISDDGSRDGSIELIKEICDPRIKIFSIEHRRSGMRPHWYVTQNFENALKHAQGNILFLADQDDIWLPGKIRTCCNYLNNHIAVMHNLECVNSDLEPLGYNWFNSQHTFTPHNFFMMNGKHMGCALCFKRELLDVILPFPKDLHIHDFWIGINAELHGNLFYIDKPMVLYRIHANNTSGASHRPNSLWFKLNYRVYTMTYVISRYLRKLLNRFIS